MKSQVLAMVALAAVSACSAPTKEGATVQSCGAPQPDTVNVAAEPGAPQGRPAAGNSDRMTGLEGGGQAAEVVRQISWQLCNARSNNWIDDAYYRRELTEMREAAFASMGGPARPRAAATSAPAPTSTPRISDPDVQVCLSAAGSDEGKRAACYS